MISDDAGGSVKVNGSRIAMVVIGAMPGSTPTRVPIRAPRKQNPEIGGGERDRKAGGEIGDQVHARAPVIPGRECSSRARNPWPGRCGVWIPVSPLRGDPE